MGFRFLAFRIMRKSFLSFKFPSLWHFCYCSLSRQNNMESVSHDTVGDWRMEGGGEAIYSAVSLGVCTAGALPMAQMLPVERGLERHPNHFLETHSQTGNFSGRHPGQSTHETCTQCHAASTACLCFPQKYLNIFTRAAVVMIKHKSCHPHEQNTSDSLLN